MQQNHEFVKAVTERIEEAKGRPATDLSHWHIVLSLGGTRYAVPMKEVVEVVRTPSLTPIPGADAYVQGIFFHKGAVVLVIDVTKRFRRAGTMDRVPEHVIIVERGKSSYGLLVDKVIDAGEFASEAVASVEDEQEGRVPTTYLSGYWIRTVTERTSDFKYEFLIPGPGLAERVPEVGPESKTEVKTYLLSLDRMLGAVEEDAYSRSVIQ